MPLSPVKHVIQTRINIYFHFQFRWSCQNYYKNQKNNFLSILPSYTITYIATNDVSHAEKLHLTDGKWLILSYDWLSHSFDEYITTNVENCKRFEIEILKQLVMWTATHQSNGKSCVLEATQSWEGFSRLVGSVSVKLKGSYSVTTTNWYFL